MGSVDSVSSEISAPLVYGGRTIGVMRFTLMLVDPVNETFHPQYVVCV